MENMRKMTQADSWMTSLALVGVSLFMVTGIDSSFHPGDQLLSGALCLFGSMVWLCAMIVLLITSAIQRQWKKLLFRGVLSLSFPLLALLSVAGGDLIHLAWEYPSHMAEVRVADQTGRPAYFAWEGMTGHMAQTDRHLVYDPTDKLAAQVGLSSTAPQKEVRRLIGKFVIVDVIVK